jgi:hypothetical protein
VVDSLRAWRKVEREMCVAHFGEAVVFQLSGISVTSNQPNWSGERTHRYRPASSTNQVAASYLSPHHHLITLPLADSSDAVKGGIND